MTVVSSISRSVALLLVLFAAAQSASAQNVSSEASSTRTLSAGWQEKRAADPDRYAAVPNGQRPEETREKFLERLGLAVDPGADPDPEKVFIRFGNQFRIDRYERRGVTYRNQNPGWVRPHAWVNVSREVYQEDDQYVWVFEPVPVPAAPADAEAPATTPAKRLTKEQEADLRNWLAVLKPDFQTLTPAQSKVTLNFKESSAGLPTSGSWRNSLDVGDMNEDGFLDLIAPPQRSAGSSVPTIFLGDGKGNWKEWTEASYPVGINYGSVSVGDLNGDKHLDMAFGVHLGSVAVFLGNGKGYFTDASPKNTFATRRAQLADADGDGDLDILALTEGPRRSADASGRSSVDESNLRVFYNDGKAKFTEAMVAEPGRQVAGDFMETGDLNGDGRLDVAAGSIYYGGTDLFYLRTKDRKWETFGRGWLPFYSYYGALTTGKFSARKRDDVVMSYVRHWPKRLAEGLVEAPEFNVVAGVERIEWTKSGAKRTPIARWSSAKAIFGMASADFDGDGNLDFVYSQVQPRQYVFMLGDGKGGFTRASVAGLEVPSNIVYDIKVADLNRDKRPDLILMYEAEEGTQNGSMHVFLNAGPSKT